MNTPKVPAFNLNISQACARIGVGKTKFWQLVSEGQIVIRKIGRRTFVLEDDLNEFIRSRPKASLAQKVGKTTFP